MEFPGGVVAARSGLDGRPVVVDAYERWKMTPRESDRRVADLVRRGYDVDVRHTPRGRVVSRSLGPVAGRDPAARRDKQAETDRRIGELVREGKISIRVDGGQGAPQPPSLGERIATYAISAAVGIAVTYVAARILQGILPPQAPALFTPPNLGDFARVVPPPPSDGAPYSPPPTIPVG